MATSRDSAGWLTLGGVRLDAIAGDAAIGTPAYVYDLDAMAAEARELERAFEGSPHLVAYAVKANTAGPIVRALAAEGCGADVVSGAELEVALACGIAPERVVFSGVAKRDEELALAIGAGAGGIAAIQLESLEEIARVAAVAARVGRRARVSIRVNPAVDLGALDTHAHIATGHDEAKFGVARADVTAAISIAFGSPHLMLAGIAVHGGSQFTSTAAYEEAARVCFGIAKDARARGVPLAFVDTGGGFGVDYGEGCPVRPSDFVRVARAAQKELGLDGLALYVEPGRSLVATHGVLVASVIQPKVAAHRRWLVIDAGMNDLIRPALYQARHRVVPLGSASGEVVDWSVVGPVCESSDDFGVHALSAEAPRAVALLDAGAYGFTMASQYNGRALPAEVFVQGGHVVAVFARGDTGAWVRGRLAVTAR